MQNFGFFVKLSQLLVVLAMTIAAGLVGAQPNSNETIGAKVSVSDPLASTLLVIRLVEHGDRQKDGLSLLVAARIADDLGLRQHAIKSGATPDAKTSASLSRLALLARAQTYAADRPDLLGLIADAQASSSRGAQRGPWADKVTAAIVQPSEFLVTFVKGVKATFGIRGDGDTDLELEIVDAAGKKMCTPPQAGDVKSCNWVPIETAEYQIVVRNKGTAANRFTYYHN